MCSEWKKKGGGAARTTSLYITAQIRSFKLTLFYCSPAEDPPGVPGSRAEGRVMGRRPRRGGHVQVTNPRAWLRWPGRPRPPAEICVCFSRISRGQRGEGRAAHGA